MSWQLALFERRRIARGDDAARQAISAEEFDKGSRRVRLLRRLLFQPANGIRWIEQRPAIELRLIVGGSPFGKMSAHHAIAVGEDCRGVHVFAERGLRANPNYSDGE